MWLFERARAWSVKYDKYALFAKFEHILHTQNVTGSCAKLKKTHLIHKNLLYGQICNQIAFSYSV